jgi:hypothetical protein
MSVIWSKITTGGWGAQRLDGALYDLTSDSVRRADEAPAAGEGAARLMRASAAGSPVWALIAPADSGVRVNGSAVAAGLAVLSDRDEIRMGGGARYFSTESLAEVAPFHGSGRTVYCGRCRQPVLPNTPSVICPGCQIVYHQYQNDSESLLCWTYSEKCNFCTTQTALDAGFKWAPED